MVDRLLELGQKWKYLLPHPHNDKSAGLLVLLFLRLSSQGPSRRHNQPEAKASSPGSTGLAESPTLCVCQGAYLEFSLFNVMVRLYLKDACYENTSFSINK